MGLKQPNVQMEQPSNSLSAKYRQKQRSKTPVNARRKREEKTLIINWAESGGKNWEYKINSRKIAHALQYQERISEL